MQSTGQTSTQELSLVPMHGSAMTYAMSGFLAEGRLERRILGGAPGACALLDPLTGRFGRPTRGSAAHRREVVRPGSGKLELGGDLEQRVLAERPPDQLDRARQPVLTESERYGDRR